MGVFIIGPRQQAVQGFPINRSYTKAEADAKFSGGSVTIYTQTPVGAIDGVNLSYTVSNTINSVILMAINGEFIHPADYSTAGAGFTMNTALPAVYSGKPFTIVYK